MESTQGAIWKNKYDELRDKVLKGTKRAIEKVDNSEQKRRQKVSS